MAILEIAFKGARFEFLVASFECSEQIAGDTEPETCNIVPQYSGLAVSRLAERGEPREQFGT